MIDRQIGNDHGLIKELFQDLPGGPEESHEESQSG
jgi:hypothetical protein